MIAQPLQAENERGQTELLQWGNSHLKYREKKMIILWVSQQKESCRSLPSVVAYLESLPAVFFVFLGWPKDQQS